MDFKKKVIEYKLFTKENPQLNSTFYENMSKDLLNLAGDKEMQIKKIFERNYHVHLNSVGITGVLNKLEGIC